MALRWKQVKDFPSYAVSDTGLIWSYKRNRLLNPVWHEKDQQLTVSLSQNGRAYHTNLSHLILKTFVSPPSPTARCGYIDGNPRNLVRSNLYWISAGELARKTTGTKAGRCGSPSFRRRMFERATDPTYEEPVYE